MKLGGAYYCNGEECGAEITGGSYCNECRPGTGSPQITYTFIATEGPNTRAIIDAAAQQPEPEAPVKKHWWQR
jgi:hypothetical protein